MAKEHPIRGDKIRIEARDWARLLRLLDGKGDVRRGSVDPLPDGRDIIRVRNDTEADLDRFSVVGLGAPLILPDENLEQFHRHLLFSGGDPVVGRFAVLLNPIPDGEIGPAAASGLVPVQLVVSSEADTAGWEWAEADVADATALEVAEAGSAQILWRETGTGTVWGVVRLHRRLIADDLCGILHMVSGYNNAVFQVLTHTNTGACQWHTPSECS